jgi:NADPH:quinone reductase-like Zn-dependent oxidoreductase
MMYGMGILIVSYPTALGCDASGIVVELGPGVAGFKVGDRVCGCTRLGSPGYTTWEEFVGLPLFFVTAGFSDFSGIFFLVP